MYTGLAYICAVSTAPGGAMWFFSFSFSFFLSLPSVRETYTRACFECFFFLHYALLDFLFNARHACRQQRCRDCPLPRSSPQPAAAAAEARGWQELTTEGLGSFLYVGFVLLFVRHAQDAIVVYTRTAPGTFRFGGQ